MGRDGDYSNVAKVYESKKEKKRRLVMNNDSESEEFVITPRVEIFNAGNGAASGRRNIVLEKGGGRLKSLTRGSEGSKGKVLESRSDRRSREIVIDPPDGEDVNLDSADCAGNETDTTGGFGKSSPSRKLNYKSTGSAREKVLETKYYRKRTMETVVDEFSRKRTKTENMGSVDNQTETSGEGNKVMGGGKSDVHISKLSVPRDTHRDEDTSSERTFHQSPRTSSKVEADRCLGRSGQREPPKVKDGRSSDVGIKKESRDDGSSQHRYIRTQGERGVLRVLKSNKKVARSENAKFQLKERRNSMRLRSSGTNRFSASNSQLERQVDKRSISNVKPRKSAEEVSSEAISISNVSKVNQENISQNKRSKKADLGAATQKKNSNESRSAVKNKLREQIKNILFDAGWKIELRPRRGRNYEDSVYVSPQGSGYWSITKAYAVYLGQFKRTLDDKESSEKEHEASTVKDNDCKEENSTLAVIPPEVLHMLKRNVVNKRRSKKEMKDVKYKVRGRKKKKGKEIAKVKYSRDKGTRDDVGGTRAIKRKVTVRNSKRRGCALLVRGFNQDEGSENGDYVPYAWKRTVLSWMIDLGVVPPNGKVRYMNKRMTRALLDGRITRDGIQCSCCSKILTVSKFEIHAGSKLHRPYENICLEVSGISLLQCQINAWEKQESSTRRIFYDLDTDGDDPNDDTCGICGDGGELICCDSCPSTFHLACLGIEMLPTGDWHCTNCSCKFCGAVHNSVSQDDNALENALFTCSQCARKYHKDCVPEDDAVSTGPSSPCNVFCGQSCRKVFRKLQKFTGVRNELEEGFYWSIVRRFEDPSKSPSRMAQTVENNSKIAVAYAVMDECFVPITDQRSGINLIHNVVYNCGSNITRLNFSGFYTFILEQGDEIVAAASVRIHDTRLAEMPFIGTRCMYRRQGMCRRLLQGVESALRSLCIRKLIIPAISELTDTWTNVFGFKPLEISQNQELNSVNMLVFPGTGLLQKFLLNDQTMMHTNPELVNKSETQISAESGKNYSPDETMDSKESKSDTEHIEPNLPVLDHSCSNLLPEESGSHAQFCTSSDCVVETESNNLESVVSCNDQVEKHISLRNCSDEVVPCTEEPKKDPEPMMDALPSFLHPASEFEHEASGTEASEFRPPQSQSNSELLITDVVENCDSEKGQKKLEDKPSCNGIAHDPISKKCEFEADDSQHEINESRYRRDANGLNSNVNQGHNEVSIDVIRHLNTSPGNGGYVSSGVCGNESGTNPKPYSVASNESTSQEKSELIDQLTISDSAKSLSGTNSNIDGLLSKLKESTPGIEQQFSANSEVGDDSHDNLSDGSIAEKRFGVVESGNGFDLSSINQASKMVK